ncbi:hypothetical protein BDW74DRAFT_154300 [Aspergillus multicolor]|uniref:uncharacterized protein n=1 Tax=Aspergillus multicolor TaxID=41759 RepID=UPI003CCD2D44
MKVFVRTGPGFNSGDGVSIVQRVEVEVYLIQHGYQNSPRDLSTNFMIYTIATNSGTRQIKGISLLYLLRGKMAAFANRREDDDVQDIQTILLNRRDEVKGFVGQLDPLDVEVFLESVPERTREHWKGFFKQ